MKRILLFLMTNIAIMAVLWIIAMIVMPMIGLNTNSLPGLIVFFGIFGFGGAFISLLLSKFMAKRSVGAVVINQPRNETEAWLVNTVSNQARILGLKMPEVAIYQADEMNAFATGAFRNSSLVAVSTGLLQRMTREEVEAVLAHEMSHVNNGDMVTMALLQGLVNTFVSVIAWVIGNLVANTVSKSESSAHMVHRIVYYVLSIVLMFIANFLILWFSRKREYRADEGAARLVGSSNMIAALKRLAVPQEEQLPENLAAFGINGPKKDSIFSTHPSIENRIAALQGMQTRR